jgi:hypothetical protein
MFVHPLIRVSLSLLLSSAAAPSSKSYASRSCTELAAERSDTDAAAARLAEWMERHCPGEMENTEPFCKLQSQTLLERLDELGELKAALAAKRCVQPSRVVEASCRG